MISIKDSSREAFDYIKPILNHPLVGAGNYGSLLPTIMKNHRPASRSEK